jgi:hypothetical protein
MLSFAYKWLGESKIHTRALPDYPRYRSNLENDRRLCRDLWGLFNEADIIVGHNADRFDIRKSNARFLAYGFKPPSPYRTVDTLKIARSKFKFDSNRLDDLGRHLRLGKKLPTTGSHLWLGCMTGDRKAWRRMRAYNARDVELLEAVYLKLRPWTTNHPNLSYFSRQPDNCPVCESSDTTKSGYAYSRCSKRQRQECRDCGHRFMVGGPIAL